MMAQAGMQHGIEASRDRNLPATYFVRIYPIPVELRGWRGELPRQDLIFIAHLAAGDLLVACEVAIAAVSNPRKRLRPTITSRASKLTELAARSLPRYRVTEPEYRL